MGYSSLEAAGAVVRRPAPVRYERSSPGKLTHMDIKELGRIPDRGGNWMLGRTIGNRHDKKHGRAYAFVHHLVDGQSRDTYATYDRRVMDDHTLTERASAAAGHSLAGISGRPSGAALAVESGHVFVGARIEAANLGSSMCTPRVAMFSALSAGERDFKRLAVVGLEEGGRLCGECPQILRDFAPYTIVLGTSGVVIPPWQGLPRMSGGGKR